MSTIPDAALDLIREFEGWRPKVYRDPVGIPTIGYGFTRDVTMAAPPMTRKQGEDRLRRELERDYLPALLPFDSAITTNQRAALLSFVFNVGPGGVGPSTGVGSALRAHAWGRAADELLRWDKAGGRRLVGLTRRRRAERVLFLRPTPVDALADYREDERRWIREHDAIVRREPDAARLEVLRRVMRKRRKAIWRVAQTTGGWDVAHRRARYRSLAARTQLVEEK